MRRSPPILNQSQASARRRRVHICLVPAALVGVWISLQSCTPNAATVSEPVQPSAVGVGAAGIGTDHAKSPTANEGAAVKNPTLSLAALVAVTGTSGRLWSDVADIRAMLHAESKEAEGDFSGAATYWFAALHDATGRFGQHALEGWLKAYTRALGKKSDVVVLARLIMAETQNGQLSTYMRNKGLTSDAAVTAVLKATVPDWLEAAEPSVGASGAEPSTPPPAAAGVPTDDPLLIKNATRNCAAGKDRQPSPVASTAVAAWQTWVASLTNEVRDYWQALLLAQCGKTNDAILALKAVYPRLAQQKTTQAMAVEAAGRAVAMQRAVGLRTEAADTYTELMELWKNPGVLPEAFATDQLTLSLRRIDETLWAARYRALLGDYENGKIYAQEALKLIDHTYHLKLPLRQTTRAQLASLKAEAYHALAFRIAVEKKEFESALSLTILALRAEDLPVEWQDKLQWSAGLYEYLGTNYASACKRWEQLLTTTRDDSIRAATYYWLAKTFTQLGQPANAQPLVDRLTDEYPLSYYSVLGGSDWSRVFGDPTRLAARLEEQRDFELGALRQSSKLGPLLARAEILVAAGVPEYGKIAVDELETAMGGELLPETHVAAYVYLTRLQYRAGSYLKAIRVTTKLAKATKHFWRQWPEQLLVYFPRPYWEEYRRNADENALEPELLLGISRQESGFNPEGRSNVNAIGVMQLIAPTATRFAAELGLPTENIDATLRLPAANIRIGSRYLKFLSLNFHGYPPAVYGGYNAGEYAVDLWLKRRAHSDPFVFVELVPFAETKDYIKNVWRNVVVYHHLAQAGALDATPRVQLLTPVELQGAQSLAPSTEKKSPRL